MLEQRRGDLQVVFTVEQVELRLLDPVISVVRAILDHGDPPHHLTVAQRHKEIRVGVFVKRVFLPVEHQRDVLPGRRNPLRMMAIKAIRKRNEALHLRFIAGIYFFNNEGHNSISLKVQNQQMSESANQRISESENLCALLFYTCGKICQSV